MLRIIDSVRLNSSREIRLVLKTSVGYQAEMIFRNDKFYTLRLTNVDSGEVAEFDRFAFLLTMHHMFTNKEAA
jgi:phage-related protein